MGKCPGDVPRHWDVKRVKQICRLAYGDALSTEFRVPGAVSAVGSNGPVGLHNSANTRGPCIVIGRKGSFGKVNYSVEPVFAIDTTFFIDSRQSSAHLRWLYYLLGWLQLDRVTRDSAIPGLARQEVYEMRAVVPPLPEQRAIARFLDHADRRIRRYIRAKEGLIELLEEQKQAIILQAVTGQIDVRTGQPYPAYKDSGVEWLGEVPEHWGMVANKAMLSRRKVLVGENHTQFRLLSLTKSGVIVRDLSTGRGKFSADMGTSQEVWKGDLVFCLFDVPETPRTIGLSGHDGMITGAYTVFECDRPLLRQFLEAFYIAMDDRKLLEPLYSGLRNTIPPSRFLGAKTPVPSRDEQAAILGYLHDSRTVADSAVTLAEREVDLLNEYRTRLIADVVTGKLDVREAAASLPEVDPLASDETRSAPEPNAATALESPEPALPLPHP